MPIPLLGFAVMGGALVADLVVKPILKVTLFPLMTHVIRKAYGLK